MKIHKPCIELMANEAFVGVYIANIVRKFSNTRV